MADEEVVLSKRYCSWLLKTGIGFRNFCFSLKSCSTFRPESTRHKAESQYVDTKHVQVGSELQSCENSLLRMGKKTLKVK